MSGTAVEAPVVVASGRLETRVRPLGGSALVRDYIAGLPRLAPFFSGHPFDPAAYRRKAEEVAGRLSPADREVAGRAIRATSQTAADRLERVLDGEGVFVTTGQQTGLFGGPLFTVYKLLMAVRLARTLERILDRPVAPLFWVAADDHDLAEVDHTFVLSRQNEVRRIALPTPADATAHSPAASAPPPPGAALPPHPPQAALPPHPPQAAPPPHPMSHTILGDDVADLVAEFLSHLPDTEFAPELREMVRRAYQPGRSMASAFEELMAQLFSSLDILVVNSADPHVKAAARPVLRRELERAEAHAALLARQSERLAGLGYHTQVTISEDAANVFLHDENGRDRLVRENGEWSLRRTQRRMSGDELFALLDAEPGSFSPNVLLRPVIESALFPTVSYVAGPSELSYFAQIGCLFDAHDIRPPVVFPRYSVTLIESKVRKVLDRAGMEADEFDRPFHEIATRLVREEMPEEIRRALGLLREDTRGDYDALAEAARAIDPTLKGWLEGLRNSALGQAENAEKKIASHLKKKNETVLAQLQKAAANLYPDGAPQERMLNPLPYLARYGTELLLELLNALEPEIDKPAREWTGVQC